MDTWSPIANALAWMVLIPIGYMFTVLYLMMFVEMLFSTAENWPENKWEWFAQCFVTGFALSLLPFFLSFGHGSLHRLLTFRSPFAEGFFSFENLATFAVALAFAGAISIIARRKYEKDKTELVLLCWPLLAILVAWFNFGSAVFLWFDSPATGNFFFLRITKNRYHHIGIHNLPMKNEISQTSLCRRTLKIARVHPVWACGDIEGAVKTGDADAVTKKVEQTVKDCLNCQRRVSAMSGSATALGMAVKSRRMLQVKLESLPKKS